MDVNSITGTALLLKSAQTQQMLSLAMTRQIADQQNMMAAMLARNVQPTQSTITESDYTFSTYA